MLDELSELLSACPAQIKPLKKVAEQWVDDPNPEYRTVPHEHENENYWDNLTLKLRNQNNIKSIQQILTREAIFYFQCPTSISQFVTVEELILFGKKTFLTFMYMFDPSILTNM